MGQGLSQEEFKAKIDPIVAEHRKDPDLVTFPTFRPQQIVQRDPTNKDAILSLVTFLKDGTMSGWFKFKPDAPPISMQGCFAITTEKDVEGAAKLAERRKAEKPGAASAENDQQENAHSDVFDVVTWNEMSIDNGKMNNQNNGKAMMWFEPVSGFIVPKQKSGSAVPEWRFLNEDELDKDRHFFAPNPWPETPKKQEEKNDEQETTE